MPKKPTILIRFWQELKRRKVFKVIAMYAGTAFIIIQVIDILTNRLNLPSWIATLVIIILSAGFQVLTVLAWIFDLTPEGIKRTESLEVSESKEKISTPVRRRLKANDIVIAVLAVAVIILAYPKIFKRDTLESLRVKGKISVAVMPFQNMTNDTTQNFWQNGIQNELITSLSNSEELKVRQTASTNSLILSKGLTDYASITPSIAGNISQKLEADVYIYGSIKEVNKSIRINAQLIDSKTGDVFRSFQIDGIAEKILPMIDSLSAQVKNFLIVSVLQKTFHYIHNVSTNSPEAFRYFIYGMNSFDRADWETAREWFSKSIEKDSNCVMAELFLGAAYFQDQKIDQAKKLDLKAYEKRDRMSRIDRLNTEYCYASLFGTTFEAINYLKQILDIDDQQPVILSTLSQCYNLIFQYDKAITYSEKAIEIISRQAILALTKGKAKDADKYIEEYKSILKGSLTSDADIASSLGIVYWEAGILDKAEEYERQQLSYEPENPDRINYLAWFLIDKKGNIDEGLELLDKALKISPDNYWLLDNKGVVLYKQGKYKEALDFLQKSWDLRMKNSFYNHDAFLELEAAKKAVAEQK
jgi:TolB-like protein